MNTISRNIKYDIFDKLGIDPLIVEDCFIEPNILRDTSYLKESILGRVIEFEVEPQYSHCYTMHETHDLNRARFEHSNYDSFYYTDFHVKKFDQIIKEYKLKIHTRTPENEIHEFCIEWLFNKCVEERNWYFRNEFIHDRLLENKDIFINPNFIQRYMDRYSELSYKKVLGKMFYFN